MYFKTTTLLVIWEGDFHGRHEISKFAKIYRLYNRYYITDSAITINIMLYDSAITKPVNYIFSVRESLIAWYPNRYTYIYRNVTIITYSYTGYLLKS